VQPARIDDLFAVRQRVASADRHNRTAGDSNTALQRRFRRDNRSILYNQIRLHEFSPRVLARCAVNTRERRKGLIGVKHALKIIRVGGFRQPK
jgi:hypothetical protein